MTIAEIKWGIPALALVLAGIFWFGGYLDGKRDGETQCEQFQHGLCQRLHPDGSERRNCVQAASFRCARPELRWQLPAAYFECCRTCAP